MYAYCGNNPVSRADLNGEAWDAIRWFLGLFDTTKPISQAQTWGNIVDSCIQAYKAKSEYEQALYAHSYNAMGRARDPGFKIIHIKYFDIYDYEAFLKSGVYNLENYVASEYFDQKAHDYVFGSGGITEDGINYIYKQGRLWMGEPNVIMLRRSIFGLAKAATDLHLEIIGLVI